MNLTDLHIEVILTGVVGIITTIASGWASWFFCKKKYNAEVDNSVIANMQQSLQFYIKLSDDTRIRLEESLKEKQKLEEEVRELRKQVFTFMSTVCYDMSCELRKSDIKNKKHGNQTNKQRGGSKKPSKTSIPKD